MANGWRELLRGGLRAVARVARAGTRTPRPRGPGVPRPTGHVALPDYPRRLTPAYAPSLDGDADPGEVVWTWVPFEDDPSQGKDRPVLVVGHDEPYLLGLMLTSKDHSRNAAKEARQGRHWMDIGSGGWDAQRRPSEVRLDRVLRIDPRSVRREGSVMPRPLFDEIVASLVEVKGW
ncbi:MAG: type II toxin-antitoxin system PemK/MazF family toxin [Cellulomonas sp.]|uniref:type II toxin-antitoxin system PemK/MazF family toxin n=1 Tax=Cellulomonas sp. 73-92 TaxID=1895740 RepID=UPI00092A76A7|nr:type II toxin-antitoxin system PemK/MazF family toxin [Cellulomonas sp. 73-92]MBN9376265.1 type II toxin-antitoxin system PemK/MazF family toxin [Cellulomonas sp.]OJV76624.1 MAG: growth inhibitor PemK [Cellulomonas sp. 73-92]